MTKRFGVRTSSVKQEKLMSEVKVIIKLNGGRGALLCNECNVILSYGSDHNTKTEHYCGECYRGQSPERMAEWLLGMDK